MVDGGRASSSSARNDFPFVPFRMIDIKYLIPRALLLTNKRWMITFLRLRFPNLLSQALSRLSAAQKSCSRTLDPRTLIKLDCPATRSGFHSHGYGSSGGGVVAAIIVIMIAIFIRVFIAKCQKGPFFRPSPLYFSLTNPAASHVRAESGKPIKTGKVFLDSFFISITFGIIGLCCAQCVGGNEKKDAPAPAPQTMTRGGFIPGLINLPAQGQGMDWTSIDSSATQAPIQGE